MSGLLGSWLGAGSAFRERSERNRGGFFSLCYCGCGLIWLEFASLTLVFAVGILRAVFLIVLLVISIFAVFFKVVIS